MDKLTNVNRIMDAIDNTILWMLLVYLVDIYLWKLTHSPLICAPLRAEVETHIHSSPLNLFCGDPTLKHPSRIPTRQAFIR
jgi:hypothetical protein